MRALWIGAVLGLLLAGCQPAGPSPDPAIALPGAPLTETTLPDPAGAPDDAPAEALPGAPEGAPLEDSSEVEAAPPPDPPMLARLRAECARQGGQLASRGTGIYACVRATRDAGRRCDEARDCEGLCLARSGTCAPFTPLFGCNEVFTLRGRRETLCVE
ncbi:MAG: hypothetical protein Kow0013_19660 [Pararhodobacter sp.]